MLTLFKNLFTKRPSAFDRPSVSTAEVLPTRAKPPQSAAAPPNFPAASPAISGVLTLSIPLRSIIEKLPEQVKETVRTLPAKPVLFLLPLQTALEQLPSGAVKIPFGQLRAAAPSDTFEPNHDQDDLMVSLPLQHILSQLDPSLLEKRFAQTYIEPPEQIRPIFGPTGQVSSLEEGCLGEAQPGQAAGSQSAPAKMDGVSTAELQQTFSPEHEPLHSFISPSTPRPVPQPPLDSAPRLQVPAHPPATEFSPAESPGFPAPGLRMAALDKSENETTGVLTLPLRDVCTQWPGDLKTALALHMTQSFVNVPLQELEPAMRSGKPAFPWIRIRSWITPALPPQLMAEREDCFLALPLKVVIPAFMSRRKRISQRRVEVTDSIPDLFAPRSMEPAAPLAPVPVLDDAPKGEAAPEIEQKASPASEIKSSEEIAVDSFEVAIATPAATGTEPAPASSPARDAVCTGVGDLFGQPAKTEWTPSEIVEHAARLAGVDGVLIGTDYGLPVASHWPAELNAGATAGFLPGIFLRIGQFTRELRLGDPDTMRLQFGNRQLLMQRAGVWFLAALSREGEQLPENQLSLVAKHVSENFS
jgi:predicted regulator of Ras-like GTPase activity (Roadblock/LC7/MglB family)